MLILLGNPLYEELILDEDRNRLLELLSTDLPFELSVPLLDEEYYWERCYLERWPDLSPPNKRVKYEKIVAVRKIIDSVPEKSEELQESEESNELKESKFNDNDDSINKCGIVGFTTEGKKCKI